MNESNKLNCNIIKDLLPSYMEGICSQDTRNIVEEHLSECADCRRLRQMLCETELVSEQTSSLEINYIKKLKRHFMKQGFFSSLILAALILTGLFTVFVKNSSFTANTYFVSLPVLLLVTRAVIPIPVVREKPEKKQKLMAVISAALTAYACLLTAILLYHVLHVSEQGSFASFSFGPFHFMPEQAGPFFDSQLMLTAFLQAVMYLTGLYRTLHGKAASFPCMGIYLTGGLISLSLDRFLKSLTDISVAFQSAMKPVLILFLEGTCIILLLTAAEKIRQKPAENS